MDNLVTAGEKLQLVLNMTTVVGLLGVGIAYQFLRALYNVSPLHPLSSFPGPILSAMTLLVELWYDLVLGGRYAKEIEKMHAKYGPIVRISPNELHCNDPSFIDEIYAGSGRTRDKPQHFWNTIAGPIANSMIATGNHEHHRIRRAPLSKFFSRGQIFNLEPEIKQLTEQLCAKFLRNPTKGQPFDVTYAYSCFTSDVISTYCFGEPMGFVTQEGWKPSFKDFVDSFLKTAHVFRFFPFLRSISDIILVVPYLSKLLGDGLRLTMDELNIRFPKLIAEAQHQQKTGVDVKRRTIFHDILESSLPESEKTVPRLSGEAFLMNGAGTETTSWALSVMSFYTLSRPDILDRLTEELKSTDPANLEAWKTLEKLPYLHGVIMESLRLSYGVAVRGGRIPRSESLTYRGTYNGRRYQYVIPAGSSIGVSATMIHHNEDIYPDSHEFIPERWTGEDGQRRTDPERGLMSFSRGSRQCLGLNLALCELYHVTAAMVLRVFPHMRLYNTTIDDVKYDYDILLPKPKASSQGVRVVVG